MKFNSGRKKQLFILLNIVFVISFLSGVYLFVFTGHRFVFWRPFLAVSLIFISFSGLYFFWVDFPIKNSSLKSVVNTLVLFILTAILFFSLIQIENFYLAHEIKKGSNLIVAEVVRVGHVTYKGSTGPRFVIIEYLMNGNYHHQKIFTDTLQLRDKLELKCAQSDPAIMEVIGRAKK